MQHNMDDKIIQHFLKCERAGFYALNHPEQANPLFQTENDMLSAEFKAIAQPIILKEENSPGASVRFEVPFRTLRNENTVADVIIEAVGGNTLIALVPSMAVKTKLKNGKDFTSSITWVDFLRIAYTFYVVTKTGFQINRVLVARIREEYRQTNPPESNFLFVQDITGKIKHVKNRIEGNLLRYRKAIRNNSTPANQIGYQCIKPFECSFKSYCFRKQLGEGDNIFELSDVKFHRLLRLYWANIVSIEELPANFELSERGQIQINATKLRRPKIKREELNSWIKKAESENQVWFLNIEFFSSLKQLGKNLAPGAIIPFGYSLIHYNLITKSSSSYKEVLRNYNSPRDLKEYVEGFINLLMLADCKIVVFYKKRIVDALNNLSILYPYLDESIIAVQKQLIDMDEIFRNKIYYSPKFRGTTYVKQIVEILCPDISYSKLRFQSGKQAEITFRNEIRNHGRISKDLYQSLIEYINHDALAIGKLYLFLRAIRRENKD